MVTVDRNKLKNESYLENLKVAKKQELNVAYKGKIMYIVEEVAKTDLFLFIKYVCPIMYARHFGNKDMIVKPNLTAKN